MALVRCRRSGPAPDWTVHSEHSLHCYGNRISGDRDAIVASTRCAAPVDFLPSRYELSGEHIEVAAFTTSPGGGTAL